MDIEDYDIEGSFRSLFCDPDSSLTLQNHKYLLLGMELFVIIKNRKISSNFFSVIRLFFRKFGKIPRIDYNSH